MKVSLQRPRHKVGDVVGLQEQFRRNAEIRALVKTFFGDDFGQTREIVEVVWRKDGAYYSFGNGNVFSAKWFDEVWRVQWKYVIGVIFIPILAALIQAFPQLREFGKGSDILPTPTVDVGGTAAEVPITVVRTPLPREFRQVASVSSSAPGFSSGLYTSGAGFYYSQNSFGSPFLYMPTAGRTSTAWAQWQPELVQSGLYEILIFIPSSHATTQNARYKVHGVVGVSSEVIVALDQSRYRDEWVLLGVFNLDVEKALPGVVLLNDLTGELNREIAFDAIVWRLAK